MVGCYHTTGSGDEDTIPPKLISHSPAANALSIDHESDIYLNFNEPINHATVNSNTFSLRDENNMLISGTYRFVYGVNFIPHMPLDGNSVYTVSVTTGITDLAGNHQNNANKWTFTTAPSGTGHWTPTSLIDVPSEKPIHNTAIWTGNEMLVWGGHGDYSTGYRYSPITNSWEPISTQNAPSPKSGHTAIWTGTEMIIWGGSIVNDGARYNPSTDTWQSISLQDAPEGRSSHTAIWTGTEMLIWGGQNGGYFPSYPVTGGSYNPTTDTWKIISTVNAPLGRSYQTAVWTGTEMIIWGGRHQVKSNIFYLSSGGRYNPVTDTWSPTSSNSPDARVRHSAIWTGSEMIVWGGYDGQQKFSSGSRYNPFMDTWIATSPAGPLLKRWGHCASWTGSSMIIWGGYTGTIDVLYPRHGGLYDPINDIWLYTTTKNAPTGRTNHSCIWNGSEMIVWGGLAGNTGGIYIP